MVLFGNSTKIYEEYQRVGFLNWIDYLAETALKGECLLIVAGASLEKGRQSGCDLLAEIDTLRVQSGSKKNQAIKWLKNIMQ